MKKIATLIAFTCWLVACREAEIPVYHGDNYIQFVKNLATDSTTVTFLYAPAATELHSELVVKMTGAPALEEQPYTLSIDRQFTTAEEGVHFRLPDKTAFKAGAMRDTLSITFCRVPEMKTRTFRLVLRVGANNHFLPGQREYQYKVFLVHDKISKPEWWDRRVEQLYLGTYSDLKFQHFIEVTGGGDMTGASASEIRINALKLKYWLEEWKFEHDGEPVREVNGDEMTVPVIG
jgi:hypothetical protein